MDIKAVVFDMDGVIIDSEILCLGCWQEVGKKWGISNVEDIFVPCIGTTATKMHEILKNKLGEDFDSYAFVKEASALFQKSEDNGEMPVKHGIPELLEALKNAGVKLGVASSTRQARVEEILKNKGLIEYFDMVLGGDVLKKSKPEPDIYLLACERLNIVPTDAWAIEDSYNGVRSAYSAKMNVVMIPDLLAPTDEMREKATIIANSPTELIEMWNI